MNPIAPGFIDTPMGPKEDPSAAQWTGWHCPLGRYGLPEEIAWPLVFLAVSIRRGPQGYRLSSPGFSL